MCVLSIKVPIRKKSGNLFNDPRITQNYFSRKKMSNIHCMRCKQGLFVPNTFMGVDWSQRQSCVAVWYLTPLWGYFILPHVGCRCNSLNKKGPKRIIQKKTTTNRRRRRLFYIFPLFPGFNNHSMGEGTFPEYNWNSWIPQLRCLKIR